MQRFDKRRVSLDDRRDRPGAGGIARQTVHAANFAAFFAVQRDLVANPRRIECKN